MADTRRPNFVVLAGPNGAGKSTVTPRVQIGPKIDQDAIAKSLNPANPDAATLPAARRAITELKTLKQQGRSFTYETTLSSNASIKEIADAKAKGYEIRLYFVALSTAEQSAERVSDRVRSGGHAIPADVINRRFELTFENALVAVGLVDRFELIDNHQGDFKSVLVIENGHVVARETSKSPRISIAIAAIIEANDRARPQLATAARETRATPSPTDLAAGVRAGDRAILARAITLVESTKAEHRASADALLDLLMPYTGNAQRIGITGVPGVGKSTTIDQLGIMLVETGHRVAVLAVDPTSRRTGGSILGDKTRMGRLALAEQAFIRPSPTAGTLGGVARKTRETMALVEAAGYDVVIVETVGVGQSETTVADMVDVFLVLLLAGAGDDLQGIKKGIIEIADIIAITKADGDNVARATRAAADYQGALSILTPATRHWSPPVLTISGLDNRGIDTLWATVQHHRERLTASGDHASRRTRQAVEWMRTLLADRLLSAVMAQAGVAEAARRLEADVAASRMHPPRAVEEIVRLANLSGAA